MVNDYNESLFIKKISNDAMTLVIGLLYIHCQITILLSLQKPWDTLGQVFYMPCYIMGDYSIDRLKHDFILQLKNSLKPCIEALYYQWCSNQPVKQL